MFEIVYAKVVVSEDIPKLSLSDKVKVKTAIEKKLITTPGSFGKPLRRSLKGYRSLRVSNIRIIYRIEEQLVKIFIIQNRSAVYKSILERI